MNQSIPTHPTVMLVAGEASGDQHAAHLFQALKTRLPGIQGIGMGGQRMREAGIELRYDASGLGVIGLAEVLKSYCTIRRALKQMQNIACQERPDLLICVDYKEFNFRLARHAKSCGIPVLFYISPQVWAWRPGRVKKYAEAVDMMAVIFPFEVPFYQAHQIPVRYVGHPLARRVQPVLSKTEAQRHFRLNPRHPVIGLLPGSRQNEIKRLIPVMSQACVRLQAQFPDGQFLLFQAASVQTRQLNEALQDCPVPPIQILQDKHYNALQCCDAVMTASGTATLELALLQIPMVIVYRLSPLTYQIGKRLVRIPDIGLANIVAGKRVVQELIQQAANPDAIATEITHILNDPKYAGQISTELAHVKQKLGTQNGTERMADLVMEMLEAHKCV